MSHKVKIIVESEVTVARTVDDASNYAHDFTEEALKNQWNHGFSHPDYREDTGIGHFTVDQEPT